MTPPIPDRSEHSDDPIHPAWRPGAGSSSTADWDRHVYEDRGHTITARTQGGCQWTLAALGNTAELEPAVQTCHLTGSTITLRFWSIASDGKHQVSVVAGVDKRGGNFLLGIGSLTKQ
jgi:hypothetical protein